MQNGNLVLKPTTCPEQTAKKLLCTTEALTTLNPIQTVIRCPVAVEGANGEIKILSLGYHNENGGILVVGGDVISDVPLKDAVDGLKSLVDEFDFQTPADRSRAIASLLSPAFAFGQLLKGRMPVDVAEADQSQAGKTFRQKLIAAVYNETPRLIARRDGGVGSLDESFSTAVIQGCPFLQFDNLRGIFDSQLVEAFLTSDRSPIRVPYRGEIVVGTRNFYILMTSNGVATTRDFANRASFVRIRKRTGYRFKRYPEGDLLAHVKANQAYYLGCVFSVIGEWLATGRPSNPDETRHDFREWAQLMDLLLTKLFGEASLMDDHPAAQERVSNPALNFIRRACMAAAKGAHEHFLECACVSPGRFETRRAYQFRYALLLCVAGSDQRTGYRFFSRHFGALLPPADARHVDRRLRLAWLADDRDAGPEFPRHSNRLAA
jgi:hypothetical protein